METSRKMDFRIPLYYLFGGLLAWAIPYLISVMRPRSEDGWENFGNALADLLMIYYSILGFLILALVSSLYGWYRNTVIARKNSYLVVSAVSAVLLVLFLVATTGR